MRKIVFSLLWIFYVSSTSFAITNVAEYGAETGKSTSGINISNNIYNMSIVPPGVILIPSRIDKGADQIGRYIIYSGAQASAGVVGTGGNFILPILLDTKTGKSWQYALTGNGEVCWIEMKQYEIVHPENK